MIKHIGQSMVPTPSRHIFLKNVLHVPHATHNLVSVHHLNSDNDVFLKLHLNFFSLRIGTRDAQFYTVHVKPGCIPSPHLLGLHSARCASVPPDSPQSNGMVAWATPGLRLLVVSFEIIICLLCAPNLLCMCVMHVDKPRVINFLFPSL
jgi:hypothetical protein